MAETYKDRLLREKAWHAARMAVAQAVGKPEKADKPEKAEKPSKPEKPEKDSE